MGCFIFGDLGLTERFEVAKVDMPAIAPTAPDLRAVPGRDGAVLAGNDLGAMEIKVTCRIATGTIDPREIQQQWADAVAALRNAGTQRLFLTPERYRMAVLTGATELEFASYSATATLTFTCPDPVAYGRARTLTVPSGGSVEFEVQGTHAALMAVTATALGGSTGLWGLRLDDGDFLQAYLGTGSTAKAVAIDCAARTLSVAGAVAVPTLDSDWLPLEPGTHELSMDWGTASGGASVTYTERWL